MKSRSLKCNSLVPTNILFHIYIHQLVYIKKKTADTGEYKVGNNGNNGNIANLVRLWKKQLFLYKAKWDSSLHELLHKLLELLYNIQDDLQHPLSYS